MILIDSVFINDGGGLVLLEYLVNELQKSDLEVCYLFDARVKDCFLKYGDLENVFFIQNTMTARRKFYKSNLHDFSHVLCFGNVPPPIRLNACVFVYFHQRLFLDIPKNFSFKSKLMYGLKQWVLKYYRFNADYWFVQTDAIQLGFAKKYLNENTNTIKVLPFYPPLDFKFNQVDRLKHTFLYVSNSSPHKNHEKLIMAFCEAYDEAKKGSLCLTVPIEDVKLCNLIKEKLTQGYPIKNVGFVNRDDLADLYLTHEYLIFPSLSESFGLGLAEAIDGGCKVIAADLPYTYQVCNPSLTFNPYSIDSIESAIIKSVTQELPESNKIITNDINQLILLLSE